MHQTGHSHQRLRQSKLRLEGIEDLVQLVIGLGNVQTYLLQIICPDECAFRCAVGIVVDGDQFGEVALIRMKLKKYDYPVETSLLPISDRLKEHLEVLIEKHDEALNWQEPQGELLWSKEQQLEFMRLQRILCPDNLKNLVVPPQGQSERCPLPSS